MIRPNSAYAAPIRTTPETIHSDNHARAEGHRPPVADGRDDTTHTDVLAQRLDLGALQDSERQDRCTLDTGT